MHEKSYGKFTLEQLKQFNNFLIIAKNLAPELQQVIRDADPEKRNFILGDDFSWHYFYEMSFKEHMAYSVFILDWQGKLQQAVESDDPQQFILDELSKDDPDEEWQGGYKGLFNTGHLVALGISTLKTMKSIMVYQKSLSTLIEEVREGSDKALFDAVRIDRTIVACPSINKRISLAEMTGDEKFFRQLKNALKGISKKHMAALDVMRYMMYLLVDNGSDKLNAENLEQIFVEQLKLYPKTPSAQKNLYKHFIATKKINHRK
jgi:hypothetical protein